MSLEHHFTSTIARTVSINFEDYHTFNELEQEDKDEILYNYLDWPGDHSLNGVNFTVHQREGTNWEKV